MYCNITLNGSNINSQQYTHVMCWKITLNITTEALALNTEDGFLLCDLPESLLVILLVFPCCVIESASDMWPLPPVFADDFADAPLKVFDLICQCVTSHSLSSGFSHAPSLTLWSEGHLQPSELSDSCKSFVRSLSTNVLSSLSMWYTRSTIGTCYVQ